MDTERGEWYLAKQIAVGMLIAAAVIFISFHIYAAVVVRAASKAAVEVAEDLEAQFQRNQAEMRARADAERARVEARRGQAEQEALQRRHQIARQSQAAADQAKMDAANAAAREQAWQRFFVPQKKCDHPPNWETQVDCGNAYIKAKREFNAKWARGELK